MEEKIFVIGYGGFLSEESLFKTIPPRKLKTVWIKGYKRVFNLRPPNAKLKYHNAKGNNVAILNVIPEEDSYTNAILFEVDKDELDRLNIRQKSYYSKLIDVYDYDKKNPAGKALLYLGKKIIHGERSVDDDFMPIDSYYKMVRDAAYSISKQFGEDFDSRTFLGNGKLAKEILNKN